MHVVVAEMASLVERLRVRSDRRPIYTLDESDEEADFVKKKSGAGPSSENFERFQRPDAVTLILLGYKSIFAFLPDVHALYACFPKRACCSVDKHFCFLLFMDLKIAEDWRDIS